MASDVKIGFYKGAGRLVDKAIRWRTRSMYSHCEMVVLGTCYSSSFRDGGVRSKTISFKPDRWDFIDLPSVNPLDVLKLWHRTQHMGYDLVGVLVGQLFEVRAHERRKWFCSEWCAEAIGFSNPWRYSPQRLFEEVRVLLPVEKRSEF